MSSSSTSWTTASKKGKVTSSPNGKKHKSYIETMPRIETKLPVEESPTIYDVLLREEARQERKMLKEQQGSAASSNVSSTVPKKNSAAPKKPSEKKKEKLPTLEEALLEVNVSDMESVLSNDKLKFPANPDVWLKDLVSLFNLKLDKVPVGDPTYSNNPTAYPSCLLSKSVKTFLLNIFSQSSTLTLNSFLDHCVLTMLSEINKGLPSHGFHIFVQLLLQKTPQIGISRLSAYLAMLKDNINKPQRALCILWAIGQAGLTNLGHGLKVWLELMLPVLNIRGLSEYAVHYLESLFRLHPSLKFDSSATLLSKREFFKLFDELFSKQPSLTNELRARMMKLYPNLKVAAIGHQPETTLHTFFSSFLSRCSSDCGDLKKTELLQSLITCLSTDKQSFGTWRQIYVKHLSQSSILLHHLANKFESVQSIVDKSLLRETVGAFVVTNGELAKGSASSLPADFERCVSTCNDLLTSLSHVNKRSHWFLMLLVIVIGGAFGFDVYNSGSVTNSCTYRWLLTAGVVDFVQQAWQKLHLYAYKVWLFLASNVPAFVNKAVVFLLPYFEFCNEKLGYLFNSAMVALNPHLESASRYLAQFITWVNTVQPLVLNTVSQYIDWFLKGLVSVTVWLMVYVRTAIDWIVNNVLTGSWSPEKILESTSELVSAVQSAASSLRLRVANLLG